MTLSRYLFAVKISSVLLKSLSTAVEEGNVTLYRLKIYIIDELSTKTIDLHIEYQRETYLYIFMMVGKCLRSSRFPHILRKVSTSSIPFNFEFRLVIEAKQSLLRLCFFSGLESHTEEEVPSLESSEL
jgi:hypothetical protein